MFAEAVTTTLFAVVVAVSNALVALFTYLIALHNTCNDKSAKKAKECEKAEKQLDDACDKGTLSDLIDATKKIGEASK